MTTLPTTTAAKRECLHFPPCPSADAPNHDEAVIIASHPEQGWYLRCNSVVSFTDTGDLYPDGHSDVAHRPEPRHRLQVA